MNLYAYSGYPRAVDGALRLLLLYAGDEFHHKEANSSIRNRVL
jgi:hypothetical protein